MCNRLLSVIVPVYNTKPYLDTCIQSICNQTYKNLEIILVDDGSSDFSGEICDDYAKKDSRIKVVHKENEGVLVARNYGIQLARGDYITFVDSDDWLELNAYESFMAQYEYNDYDLITFRYYRNYQESESICVEADAIQPGIYTSEQNLSYIFNNLLFCNNRFGIHGAIWRAVFKKQIIKCFFHKIPISMRYLEDACFFYLYCLHCKTFILLSDYLYHYRATEGSTVHKVYTKYLSDLSDFYVTLLDQIKNHAFSKCLTLQLQKFVNYSMICRAGTILGFDQQNQFPSYLLPFDDSFFKNKTVVLYGAGSVGKSYFRQLKSKDDIHGILWVDNNFESCKKNQFPVSSLDSIFQSEYDCIIIAAKNKQLADAITTQLVALGINHEKIFWKLPKDIFEYLGMK